MDSSNSSAPTLAELRPMLLCERKTIPRGPGSHFEIKYDGYRLPATTGDAPRLNPKKREWRHYLVLADSSTTSPN